MSTHSNIGILLDDGRVRFIYCHSDGYTQYVGTILKNYYANSTTIEALIAKRDISRLGLRLQTAEELLTGIVANKDSVTVSYWDWRGEATDEHIETVAEYIAGDYGGAEYRYLWTGFEWLCINTDTHCFIEIKEG